MPANHRVLGHRVLGGLEAGRFHSRIESQENGDKQIKRSFIKKKTVYKPDTIFEMT